MHCCFLPRLTRRALRLVCCLAVALLAETPAWAARGGELELIVVDRDSGQPLPCRMHLKNAAGRPQKAGKLPFWKDHFVFDGRIKLKLPPGAYSFEIERGPEYLVRTGHFTINDSASDTKTVDLKRFVDMSAEGWWSGDLDVERPAKDLELIMRADDLHVVPLTTWSNRKNVWTKSSLPQATLVQFDDNRFYHLMAGTDARPGGRFLLLNLEKPSELPKAASAFPLLLDLLTQAEQQDALWIDAASASAWDLPILIAHGKVDSVELADRHLCRSTVIEDEPGSKPRDKVLFPSPRGVGRWSEAIYYHLLNCGLRIPPSAGSGSGVAPNPAGYNRMYVHVEEDFSYEKWWQSLRAGRVMVTNGPLIRASVEGELPGHVFHADAGQEVELEIGLTLSTRDKVAYLEIVKDGRVAFSIPIEKWRQEKGRLPLLRFSESGWFLIRAVTEVEQTYRFASTGPYYVEIGYKPRISRESAQFFLDWINERAEQHRAGTPAQQGDLEAHLGKARDFWQDLRSKANAD